MVDPRARLPRRRDHARRLPSRRARLAGGSARRAGGLELDRHRDARRAPSGRSARSRASRRTSACSCSACSRSIAAARPSRCSASPARSCSSRGWPCCRGCSRSCFPANETGAFLAIAQSRLNWPLNYWNGLAAFCALGVPLALSRSRPAIGPSPFARSSAGALPVLALCISLTISRGGIVAVGDRCRGAALRGSGSRAQILISAGRRRARQRDPRRRRRPARPRPRGPAWQRRRCAGG